MVTCVGVDRRRAVGSWRATRKRKTMRPHSQHLVCAFIQKARCIHKRVQHHVPKRVQHHVSAINVSAINRSAEPAADRFAVRQTNLDRPFR
eukprot:252043-Chlamydomonas_euryale.AAC.1